MAHQRDGVSSTGCSGCKSLHRLNVNMNVVTRGDQLTRCRTDSLHDAYKARSHSVTFFFLCSITSSHVLVHLSPASFRLSTSSWRRAMPHRRQDPSGKFDCSCNPRESRRLTIASFWDRNDYCDVTLRCGEKEYHTSKFLICSYSDYFDKMFKSGMKVSHMAGESHLNSSC